MELGQVLEFLARLVQPRGPPGLHAAYADFVGHDGADLTEVRDILARFAFLLGENDDGQHLFPDGPL